MDVLFSIENSCSYHQSKVIGRDAAAPLSLGFKYAYTKNVKIVVKNLYKSFRKVARKLKKVIRKS